jgi:FAD/FMN-containing dehydrogenase
MEAAVSALIGDLERALGPGGVLTGEAAQEAAVGSWGRLGQPLAVVQPRSTDEVSLVLRLAHAAGVPICPWGGKTGLVEGARADGALALSLARMNRIEQLDVDGRTLTAEAGCILQTACEAAEAQDLLLPLDLGARGSATLGGVVSTNAGGNRVIRYGMTRDLVLGVEAVLADGTIVSSMSPLLKNNTGYDLKQLFIGSEGTLGVVTRAIFRLRPKPRSRNSALVAVSGFEKLAPLLGRMDRDLAGDLSAFEVMWADYYRLVTTEPARGRPPLPYGASHYVLVESTGGDEAADAERFEQALAAALEAGEADDVVITKSESEREALWAIRDDVGQGGRDGPIVTYDVSLRIPDMEGFLDEVRAGLTRDWPAGFRLFVFGHLGDGNLHLVVGVGERGSAAKARVNKVVYEAVSRRAGSISAEHGVGLEKKPYLGLSRSAPEIAVMRQIKAALDPKGILNPGKIFDPIA